jgi:hypothetical protein
MVPLNPLSFHRLAQQLASQLGEEASLRTAAGRAYYAILLIARDKTGTSGGRNVHKRVIEAVRRRTAYRSTGDQLDALRRLRTVADYEMLPADPANRDWVANWSRADSIVNRVLPRLQSWT